MLCRFYRYLSLDRHKRERFYKGVTLIELLLTVAILGVLSAIAVPVFTGYMNDSRIATANADISNIASQIEKFFVQNGRPPNSFNEAGINPPTDPWGGNYQYLRIAGLPIGDWQGQCRRDQSFNPLNADYDLYSNGSDGLTEKQITEAESADDIIRANNGGYIGLASDY